MTDQRIIGRVLSGHRDDFGVLVDRYLPMVYSLVRGRLRNTEDVEDAVQGTFLKSFTTLDTLRDRKRFRPWLATIARNTCGDIIRKAHRDRNLPKESRPDEPIVRSDPERREVHEVIRREIDLLDPDHREVLLLHYFSGMKIREIADALNVSSSVVAKRIQRGRFAVGEKHSRGTRGGVPRLERILEEAPQGHHERSTCDGGVLGRFGSGLGERCSRRNRRRKLVHEEGSFVRYYGSSAWRGYFR